MIDRNSVIALVRAAAVEAKSQRNLAHQWSVSESYITDVLSGYRDPGKKILDALGYERVVLYRRKGEQ